MNNDKKKGYLKKLKKRMNRPKKTGMAKYILFYC
jgi:hypothetical protein